MTLALHIYLWYFPTLPNFSRTVRRQDTTGSYLYERNFNTDLLHRLRQRPRTPASLYPSLHILLSSTRLRRQTTPVADMFHHFGSRPQADSRLSAPRERSFTSWPQSPSTRDSDIQKLHSGLCVRKTLTTQAHRHAQPERLHSRGGG